jgi:aminoglycoside 6'-N-acetyltransferase I
MTLIRAPRPDDEGEWLRMRRALWPECPEEEHRREMREFPASEGSPSSASRGASAGDVVAFVAERAGGSLCGFLEASIRPFAEGTEARPVGYIEGWYVDPDTRRRGVGRALVEAAEAWARAQGCRQMASDALVDNTISIASHKRLGYREVERLVHFAKDLD